MALLKKIFVPVFIFFFTPFTYCQAINLSPNLVSCALPNSASLTKKQVRDYIKTRIATNRLQEKMKKHATNYVNVVQTFYQKREALLKQRGWTVEEFESVRDRIIAAVSAMEIADDLKKSEKDHQKEITDLRENKFYNKKQKAKMIKAMNMLREQQREQYIEPTKADWPAVKPYRKKLNQLTDWVAGNIAEPPKVE